MSYDERENEHQELFHLDVDPAGPIAIHIPSPLGRLPYYIYVRVPRDAAASLDAVGLRVDVGGRTICAGRSVPEIPGTGESGAANDRFERHRLARLGAHRRLRNGQDVHRARVR